MLQYSYEVEYLLIALLNANPSFFEEHSYYSLLFAQIGFKCFSIAPITVIKDYPIISGTIIL